jgi:uncharacterized protein (DUF885 family)
MKANIWLGLLFCVLAQQGAVVAQGTSVDTIVSEYIDAWKRFQPSAALAEGFVDSLASFEDLSPASIAEWIVYNEATRARLEGLSGLDHDGHIDCRLLQTQIRKELERWQHDRPHETSLGHYSDLIADAFDPVLASPLLSANEKRRILLDRLVKVEALANQARHTLIDGRPEQTREALDSLDESSSFIEQALPEDVAAYFSAAQREEFQTAATAATGAIRALIGQTRRDLLPRLTMPSEPILGRDVYARKLAIYTDSDLTPEQLAKTAWNEIVASKAALEEMAIAYWQQIDPATPVPNDFDTVVGRAFDDLENNRPLDEQSYLIKLRQYGQEVMEFVRNHDIATTPDHQTLSIELAPESSGPMARIGYVSSAPSFHPNPWTTWYLATIPDNYPQQERIDFWRSFNYSFKRFIVIHELFPGHYMQLKILRENPHRVRILFPYRPFIEGWATFTERIVLDAGYAAGDWLTRFAQLRKRLENANRAYMSVQAHCNGWSEAQVTEFSIGTSLLAPQFAKSLWGRLMRSPMQIITYMLVGVELREIYDSELDRLGESFSTKHFMDTVLRTGPVPSDELAIVLKQTPPPVAIAD